MWVPVEIAAIYALLVGAYWCWRGGRRSVGRAFRVIVRASEKVGLLPAPAGFARRVAALDEARAAAAKAEPAASRLPRAIAPPASAGDAIGREVAAMRRALAREIAERKKKPQRGLKPRGTADDAAAAGRASPAAMQRAESALAELEAMVGLEAIKARMREIADLAWMERERVERGMKASRPTYHMVFTGNPGTGKTVVARLVSRIFHEIGVLKRGHLVEANRSSLVGKFIGQTAPKVDAAVAEAKGGVLFIDEAYLLAPGDSKGRDFGGEAIGTLIEHMEKRREDLVVVAAGYREPMERFMESNPGLRSRLSAVIDFPDYDAGQLFAIFAKICVDNDYELCEAGAEAARREIGAIYAGRGETFGNAREMRNLFDRCVMRLGGRLRTAGALASDDALRTITASDIGAAYAALDAGTAAERGADLEDEIARYEAERDVLRARLKALGGEIAHLDAQESAPKRRKARSGAQR